MSVRHTITLFSFLISYRKRKRSKADDYHVRLQVHNASEVHTPHDVVIVCEHITTTVTRKIAKYRYLQTTTKLREEKERNK